MDVLILLLCAIFAVVTAVIALNKNRNTFLWWILGFCFGIFALIAIICLPTLENEMVRTVKRYKFNQH